MSRYSTHYLRRSHALEVSKKKRPRVQSKARRRFHTKLLDVCFRPASCARALRKDEAEPEAGVCDSSRDTNIGNNHQNRVKSSQQTEEGRGEKDRYVFTAEQGGMLRPTREQKIAHRRQETGSVTKGGFVDGPIRRKESAKRNFNYGKTTI